MMEALPVEILIQIFNPFCFHCQHSGVFPNADLDEVREDKRVLAQLCRTSKAICAVAQPILFHYYATGNSKIETRLYKGRDGFVSSDWEPDRLPQFIRSLVHRSDLAPEVVAMHIVANTLSSGYELRGYDDQSRTIRSLGEISLIRGLPQARHWPDDGHISQISKLTAMQRRDLHYWLIKLAMILTPRLKSLFLATGGDIDRSIVDLPCQVRLPSVRTVALMGKFESYHIHQFKELYSALPNLENLYTCDASKGNPSGTEVEWKPLDGDLRLSSVKKLALSDLYPRQLASLLASTSKLEDLEYYCNTARDENVYLDTEDLATIFQPVKSTLRRLCVSFLSPMPQMDYPDPFPQCIVPPYLNCPIGNFRDFERLEELSIDSYSVNREDDRDEADKLVTLLPRSIRKLRITYLFNGMEKSLRELAIRAPERFPFLESVVIGIAERTEPKFDWNIERTKEVGKLFEASGVRFSWKTDILGSDPRTMIPGAMPGSRLIPIPRIVDEPNHIQV
ncbi:hypothetical protein M426DRAFT_90096 [Hypoxylon sp. CI-4A]|nr:hypothetical protein M426DRAFT_90096 [Hypoxylon sp. CI-4A]